ncbi:MAG: HAMP domain-containing sensor histidine kinase [Clostridiales bacterium]
MNNTEIICIAVAIMAVLIGVTLVVFNYYHTRKIMIQLKNMVTDAINGTFTENKYDESRLSAVEISLKQYLQISAHSADKIKDEKEKINTLISDISHQTKTPTANILLYAQLLGEQKLPKEAELCVEEIGAQAEKLNFLIGALVKASRLEKGIIAIVPSKCNVKDLLENVVNQISPKAGVKNIALSLEVNDEDIAVFDNKWTMEAIYNIADNAVKYTDSGKISISGEPYELFYRVDISDTGMGIKNAEINKIFNRFYKGEAVKDHEGVGLGLYLANEIILAENGYIRVKSQIGKGSTFSVFLPRN